MNAKALRAPDPGPPAEHDDTWPELGALAVPTLIMIGRLDVPDVQAVDEQAASIIPGAQLVWLDDVAHLPHLEADPTCLREINEFVDRLAEG
jgi:pimeloyl-ACP methyl ester carboxylesterase